MAYLYETHLHTNQASACSAVKPEDYVLPYLRAGYKGIIVTDHFFRGNCSLSPLLPWKEKVKQFAKGYEDAKNLGLQKGLDVFFGWEENYQGTEFLIYGLSPQWLMEHPQVENWTIAQQFEAVTAHGGCVVQAHPYRDRFYISRIRLYPYLVHGIEGYNGGNGKDEDLWANAYANHFNLPITAGTDIHKVEKCVKESLLGVAFDKPLNGIEDYVKAIKTKASFSLNLCPEKKALSQKPLPEKMPLSIPMVYFDENEKTMAKPRL